MSDKLSIECVAFKECRKGTNLLGFASVRLPAMRLTIHGIAVSEQNGSRWIGLPGKPQTEGDRLVLNQRGKPVYFPVLEFDNDAVRDAFKLRVLIAVDEYLVRERSA